jgi:hypothetical protein
MRGFLAKHLGVFDPDDIRILVGAFDKAWEAVQASGEVFDSKARVDTARAILAKHIIAAAKDGERDEGRLRDGALVALAQSNVRSALRPPHCRPRHSSGPKQRHFITHNAEACRKKATDIFSYPARGARVQTH